MRRIKVKTAHEEAKKFVDGLRGVMSLDEAEAVFDVRNGADVYCYGLAKTLRGLEKRTGEIYFELTKAMNAPKDGRKKQPYFGAIATELGVLTAQKILADQHRKSKATSLCNEE